MKKEILFLLTQDLESPSGLGRYRPMAKELAKRGFRVRILALHPDYENLEQKAQMVDGVELHYVSQMHVKKQGSKTSYFPLWKLPLVVLKAASRLKREGAKYQPDYVLVGKPHPMNGLAGISVARKTGAKLIVDCDDYETESNHYANGLQKALVRHFEFSIPKKAWRVTTNTYFMKQKLIEAGVDEERIVYLSNGVDRERFSGLDLARLETLREELELAGKKTVLYLGSLNLSNHPVDLIIKAFPSVVKALPEARLLIVGGGKDLENLKALGREQGLEEQLIFTGRVAPEDAPLYYLLADLTVDPADDSPASAGRAPLKIFESWAAGKPVLSSAAGDRPLLAESAWGPMRIADVKPEALAEAIVSLLKVPPVTPNNQPEDAPYYWDRLVEGMVQQLFEEGD